jgi:hypothetical protein
MFKPVCWSNEDAQDDNGVKKVTVILWDYEARKGKARIGNCGPQVDVFGFSGIRVGSLLFQNCRANVETCF